MTTIDTKRGYGLLLIYALTALVVATTVARQAHGAPLTDTGTFCAAHKDVCSRGPVALLTAKGTTDNVGYVLELDPTTGALPISGSITATNPSVGATGAAVPASATFIAGKNGGNLIGFLVSSAGVLSVDGSAVTQPISAASLPLPTGAATLTAQNTGNTSVANIDTKTPSLGQAAMAASSPVVIASNQSSLTVAASNLPTTADTNTGAAGASTLRTVLATRHETVSTPLAAQLSNGTNAVDYNSGAAGAATLRAVLATRHEAVATPLAAQLSNGSAAVDYGAGISGTTTMRVVPAGRPHTTAIVASNNYAGTSVTTSAYVQLISSTANAIQTVCISDSSGSILKLATGAAASEVDRIYLPAGGAGCYGINIPASTRISLEALDATASTGYFIFTGY